MAQARVATTPVLSSGDNIDVLVCFNEEAYQNHKEEISNSGVVIYNSGEFEPDDLGE